MPTRTLDFGKALTFMFEEPDWIRKFVIGVGLMIAIFPLVFLGVLPALIPAFILAGYSMEISRRVAQQQRYALPEWAEWKSYLKDGAYFGLATLIYTLPAIVPIVGMTCAMIALSDSSGEMSGPMVLVMFGLTCLIMLYIIPLYVVLYGGLIEYLRTGEFRAFFRFRNLSALKAARDGNPRNHFALVLFMILIPLGMVGSVIPILGSVWAFLAQGHLLGQVLQETGFELPAAPTAGIVTSV